MSIRRTITTQVTSRWLQICQCLRVVCSKRPIQAKVSRVSVGVFPRESVRSLEVDPLLVELEVERMKAVFITGDGIYGYNLTPDGLQEVELDDCAESRIELIADSIDDQFEAQLLSCELV